VVASEPYGVVEITDRYLRLDGETPANPDNPTASRGQIVVLDGSRAGTVEGIERVAYDGTPLPVTEADLTGAQITTRDIDRGDYPHFLLKEIVEAPSSFRKTLRGKLAEQPTARVSGCRSGRTWPAHDDLRPRCATAASGGRSPSCRAPPPWRPRVVAAAADACAAGEQLRVESQLATRACPASGCGPT
jgi:glucosamine--fructose-6-phosphate aminotransferase (isomerizing)